MNEADRICRHCSTYACGKQDPADMCDGALREKLAEAEARAERYRELIEGCLDWGAMTGSDRDLWESRFRAALATPPEAEKRGGE